MLAATTSGGLLSSNHAPYAPVFQADRLMGLIHVAPRERKVYVRTHLATSDLEADFLIRTV